MDKSKFLIHANIKNIYVTKPRSSVLCLHSFIRFIKCHYDRENGIALYKLGNIETYLKKWSI